MLSTDSCNMATVLKTQCPKQCNRSQKFLRILKSFINLKNKNNKDRFQDLSNLENGSFCNIDETTERLEKSQEKPMHAVDIGIR